MGPAVVSTVLHRAQPTMGRPGGLGRIGIARANRIPAVEGVVPATGLDGGDVPQELRTFRGGSHPQRSSDDREVFWLGGTERSSHLVRVEEWSPPFRLLFGLVWSFSSDPRYRPSAATLARAREQAHATEVEFAELLTPPAPPPR